MIHRKAETQYCHEHGSERCDASDQSARRPTTLLSNPSNPSSSRLKSERLRMSGKSGFAAPPAAACDYKVVPLAYKEDDVQSEDPGDFSRRKQQSAAPDSTCHAACRCLLARRCWPPNVTPIDSRPLSRNRVPPGCLPLLHGSRSARLFLPKSSILLSWFDLSSGLNAIVWFDVWHSLRTRYICHSSAHLYEGRTSRAPSVVHERQ
jgi:hypothetical protein